MLHGTQVKYSVIISAVQISDNWQETWGALGGGDRGGNKSPCLLQGETSSSRTAEACTGPAWLRPAAAGGDLPALSKHKINLWGISDLEPHPFPCGAWGVQSSASVSWTLLTGVTVNPPIVTGWYPTWKMTKEGHRSHSGPPGQRAWISVCHQINTWIIKTIQGKNKELFFDMEL